MSYNSAIPQASDPRALSQRQILANFQAISTVFGNNHFAMTGSNENQGMHTVLTMNPQGSDPTTSSGQIGFYNKLDSNTIPELFFRPQNNATPIQLTYPSVGTSGSPHRYYSFVAGPFVVYGGYITSPTNGQVITLSPSTTLVYAGVNQADTNPSGIYYYWAATTLSGSTFKINCAQPSTPTGALYFLAIGKP